MITIKNPRDFAAAILFIALGLIGLWFGQDYNFGTSARMGPGYFPVMISGLLIVLGLIVLIGALRVSGPALAEVNWRGMALIVAGILVFGVLIERVGLIASVLIAVVVVSLASRDSRPKEIAILAFFLMLFCTTIFVYALNQPLTLFGGR